MINGAWDVLIVFAVQYWWVETKGKTLEEIDEMIEGVKSGDGSASLAQLEGKEQKIIDEDDRSDKKE